MLHLRKYSTKNAYGQPPWHTRWETNQNVLHYFRKGKNNNQRTCSTSVLRTNLKISSVGVGLLDSTFYVIALRARRSHPPCQRGRIAHTRLSSAARPMSLPLSPSTCPSLNFPHFSWVSVHRGTLPQYSLFLSDLNLLIWLHLSKYFKP
jgi:hypothetical protein